MKLIKKIIPFLFLASLLAGCNNSNSSSSDVNTDSSPTTSVDDYVPLPAKDVDSFDRTYVKMDSNSLYVNKVENLSDQNFIMGMDASSVIAEENSGVKYYDYEGNETDVFKVLSDSGINYIRVRIWNDPYDKDGKGYGGGNNDLETAIKIGKRATQYNMSLLVDFHYSDFWADPSKQMCPKAWEDMDITTKSEALYEYTKQSLTSLIDEGVKVGMVQLGNETNGGLMAGEYVWNSTLKLMKAGSKAVREVCPNALVAVHFTNPEKNENMLNYASRISTLDYDVFGTSYYPWWHGTLDNLSEILSTIAKKYNKYTMVMETSYAFTTEDSDGWSNTIGDNSGYDIKSYPMTLHGQTNCIVDIVDTIVNHTTNGIGVCYWEGTWISVGSNNKDANLPIWEQYGSGWATSYSVEYDPNDAGLWYGGCAVDNQALFDSTGHPLESLKMFNLMRFGNETEVFVDGVEDIEITHYNTDDFTLPKTVNAVYNNNAKAEISVKWDNFDIEAAKKNGNARYKIHGVADGYDVYCTLIIMEFNFVENYSFETGDSTSWNVNVNSGTLSDTHKVKVTNENPQSGKYAFHFWTSNAGGVNFDLSQDFTNLNSGTYKLQLAVLGGGSGSDAITASLENVYIYAKIDDVIVSQTKHTITKYADGYKTVLLGENINYTKGKKLTIGIHVEIKEANCWGDIDDVMLNLA
ncbi:MAG: glycosyl hydrolase 53 family protein [Bacillales bacterium]|nr:glycosyl hydrolase 53 family protein [Bacillales bacterium]